MKWFYLSLLSGLFAAFPALAPAQSTAPAKAPPDKPDPISVLKGRPDVTNDLMLGGSFQDPLAGVAFRVPAGCAQVRKAGDEIARFANDAQTWLLIVNKSASAQPLELTAAAPKMGLLEIVAARLKQSNPGIEFVRQDTVNLGEYQAGIIAARYTAGTQRKLLQEAIVQANDQLYYTFELSTPADKDAKGADSTDPAEQRAVESFREMLDTIKLLDRGAIKDEQNARLFRTREFFASLNEKTLKAVLVPETWLRLMHDGKDVGYTYIVEELGALGPNEGIKIGIRSRSYPDQTIQVDGETWYSASFDRRHEMWQNLAWVQNLSTKKSDQFTEVGTSDRSIRRAADRTGKALVDTKEDPRQPPTIDIDDYSLEVQTIGKTKSAAPMKQELPPWYLPQAFGHLLPRLLPLRTPNTYLFAVYVSDQGHVMHRYVDVGSEQDVDLAGKQFRAIPITDRIGLEGASTIHYISADGKYLGSVNKESKITIVPTDAATLQKIWANRADLTRPRDIQPAPPVPAK